MNNIKKFTGLSVERDNIQKFHSEDFSFNQWKAELTKELPTFWKLIRERNSN